MKKFTLLFTIGCFSLFAHGQEAAGHYEIAMTYKQKDNYTEANRQMAKALTADPNNEKFKAEMADIQYMRKVFFESIPLYEEMLVKEPNNLLILARLAEMYSMSPKKAKGVEYAERALKLKPTDGQINKILARTFMEVKHFPKAINCYKEAEKVLPKDLDIPFKIAACYSKLSNFGDAMQYYEKTITLDPTNPTKIYETANSCYDANYYKRANELYQLAEDKGYFQSKVFYDNWALTCIELKDYDKALFYYAKAKEFAPFDKDISLSIAELHMKKGDFNKSREVLDEMLEMNPNDAQVIYTKGMTFYKMGNTAKAEFYFNRAFEIDPSLKTLRYTKSSF